MRLIDADALKEEIVKRTPHFEQRIAFTLCFDAIRNAPTVNRWVSVRERLPEKSGYYLVCGKWRSEPYKIWICEFMKGDFVSGWMNHVLNPVVNYWMALNEPPKEATE